MRFTFVLFLFNSLFSFGQAHLVPANGGNGLSGGVSGSFRMSWQGIDSVQAYEYILTDNPSCFEGCPGDTRQNIIQDTTIVEYNLEVDKWYYWRTRLHYNNGDTSSWSGVSSFLALNEPTKPLTDFVEVYPNPCRHSFVQFKVNWGIDPSVNEIEVSVYDLGGRILVSNVTLQKGGEWIEVVQLDCISCSETNSAVLKVNLVGNESLNGVLFKRIAFAN